MITRIRGHLESVLGTRAIVVPAGDAMAYEVLVPAFVGLALATKSGQTVTLHTLQYFEGQNQGSSFIPRLIGFENEQQREFFELFTTVNGIGNRKALRALVHKPGVIARAIAEKDAKLLSTLPEIGKRMAERVIAELDGKVDAFLTPGESGERVGASRVEVKRVNAAFAGPAEDAVLALMALGQSRSEAEEGVGKALARAEKQGRVLSAADKIVEAVFGG
ncbi:MAG TPA: Holliday junction branch migration protein RuvA [Phycisphaerales bacterium]|nr:Holliday junction branch migration protein RuvA [Phycisphaerales bacterium]